MRRSERDWVDGDERTRVFVEETVRAATRARARNGMFPPIGRKLATRLWGPARLDSPGDAHANPAPSRPGVAPVATLEGRSGAPSRSVHDRRRGPGRAARLRVTAASLAVAVVGLGSLGGAGALPQPLQDFMAVTVARRVGLELPPSQGPADEEIPGRKRPAAPASPSTLAGTNGAKRSEGSARLPRRSSHRSSSSTTVTSQPGSTGASGDSGRAATAPVVAPVRPAPTGTTSTTVPAPTTTVAGSGDPDPTTTTTTVPPPSSTTTTVQATPPEPRDPPS